MFEVDVKMYGQMFSDLVVSTKIGHENNVKLLNILTYACLGNSANVSRSPEVVNYLRVEAYEFAFYALFLRYKIDLRKLRII